MDGRMEGWKMEDWKTDGRKAVFCFAVCILAGAWKTTCTVWACTVHFDDNVDSFSLTTHHTNTPRTRDEREHSPQHHTHNVLNQATELIHTPAVLVHVAYPSVLHSSRSTSANLSIYLDSFALHRWLATMGKAGKARKQKQRAQLAELAQAKLGHHGKPASGGGVGSGGGGGDGLSPAVAAA
jgi:hypothetical protein